MVVAGRVSQPRRKIRGNGKWERKEVEDALGSESGFQEATNPATCTQATADANTESERHYLLVWRGMGSAKKRKRTQKIFLHNSGSAATDVHSKGPLPG